MKFTHEELNKYFRATLDDYKDHFVPIEIVLKEFKDRYGEAIDWTIVFSESTFANLSTVETENIFKLRVDHALYILNSVCGFSASFRSDRRSTGSKKL